LQLLSLEMYLDGGVKILSLRQFIYLFSIPFLYYVLLIKVQELACIVRDGVKKTLIANNGPLHLFMGKITHPESIG